MPEPLFRTITSGDWPKHLQLGRQRREGAVGRINLAKQQYTMTTTYSTGSTVWAHGEPCDFEQGVAMHKLLGPCPICGAPTFNYGGNWRCRAPYCVCSDSNPAPRMGPMPSWWDTGIQVLKDGDAWCAVEADFINLQESIAGFGATPDEAVANLNAAKPATP